MSAPLSRVLTITRSEKLEDGTYRTGNETLCVYGNGLIYEYSGDIYHYHHYNNLGSTVKLTDAKGRVTASFTYGAYGELLSGDTTFTRFLYNGRCGVSTDDNGLYYMRQRYYNPEIKRFINQDVITGSISNSQSLNRYCYVQGNPVSYTDPFGLSPLSGLFTWNGLAHCLLGLLGNVPFLGVLANLVDAGIYLFVDHDYFMAGVSGVAAITMGASCVASWAAKSKTLANGVKVARNAKLAKTAQYVATVGDLVSDGLNFADNADNLGMAAGIMLGKYVIGGQEFDESTKYEALGLGMALMGFVTSGGSMLRNGSKLDGMLQADGFYDSLKRLKMDNRGCADLSYFFPSLAGKSGSNPNTYYHSCADEVADIIADTGFRTDLPNEVAAFHNNRYGRGVYLADSPATALAERPGGTILKVSGNPGKNLDITSRGVIGGDDYTMTHAIARGARKHGFDSITFMSAKNPDGVNTVIFNPVNVRVEEILR